MQRRNLLLTLGALLAARPAFALYDAAPDPLLVLAAGAWTGALTYRDYQPPNTMVTLPTRLSVALLAPRQLALYYAFDDGPGKTVYSYEQMAFDFTAGKLAWTSGGASPERDEHQITAVETGAAPARIRFERVRDGVRQRHVLELAANSLVLAEFERDKDGAEQMRNRYAFTRATV